MTCVQLREVIPTAFDTSELLRQLGGVEAALVGFADPGSDSRVLLIGPTPLDLACALACCGVSHVRVLRADQRLRDGSADVVIVAGLAAPDLLAQAVVDARSVLAPPGTVAIRLPVDPDDVLVQQTARALALHGFALVQARTICGETLLRAEAPLFGRPGCA